MEDYIAEDEISKEILNSAKLLQIVNINALILGNLGVGKKKLARIILPKAKIYKAKTLQKDIEDDILDLKNEAIIVDKIEELTNIDIFLDWVKKYDMRIIATSTKTIINTKLNNIFSINIEIPDLSQRKKDTKELIKKFSKEASKILDLPYINKEKLVINTENNTHSLRKSIYFSYIFENIGENELLLFLEKYFSENLHKKTAYKDLLYIFDIPLLKSYQKQYKSQVQMAKNLQLNRITLRKKLDLYKDKMKD